MVAPAAPVRVVFSTDSPAVEEAERAARALLGSLGPRFEPSVVGTSAEVVAFLAGGRPGTATTVLPKAKGRGDVASLRAHASALRDLGADIVHVDQHLWSSPDGVLAAALAGVPSLCVVHGVLPRPPLAARLLAMGAARLPRVHVGASGVMGPRVRSALHLTQSRVTTVGDVDPAANAACFEALYSRVSREQPAGGWVRGLVQVLPPELRRSSLRAAGRAVRAARVVAAARAVRAARAAAGEVERCGGSSVASIVAERHPGAVRGRVLLVGEAEPSAAACEWVVWDRKPRNRTSTLLCDLERPGALGTGEYECAIALATSWVDDDDEKVVENLLRALRPGGSLFVAERRSSPDGCSGATAHAHERVIARVDKASAHAPTGKAHG